MPMPPRPMTPTTSYFPILVGTGVAMLVNLVCQNLCLRRLQPRISGRGSAKTLGNHPNAGWGRPHSPGRGLLCYELRTAATVPQQYTTVTQQENGGIPLIFLMLRCRWSGGRAIDRTKLPANLLGSPVSGSPAR